MLLSTIIFIVVLFGSINLIKMALLLIGSDIYELNKMLKTKQATRKYQPFISVIIPAHNEEKNILSSLSSVLASTYPKSRFEVVVADDGSTDNTVNLINEYKQVHQLDNVKVFSQKNQGKAHALNTAIRELAAGSLVMCLDADSQLSPTALANMADHFRDKRVVAASTNVKIMTNNLLISLIQEYEYLINHQAKRALTTFNIEYIVGGVGSTFRKSFLERVGYYDTNTVTEDIDLTLKIITKGNIKNRVVYASDVITYTESVPNFSDLVKQRLRWKYGRAQSFYKNKQLFFNSSQKYSKFLTFIFLPLTVVWDFIFLFEPLSTGFIVFLLVVYGDAMSLATAFMVVFFFMTANILLENTISIKQKMYYLVLTPPMYFLIFILTIAEYIGVLIFLTKLPKLKQSIENQACSWQHVQRTGNITAV